MMPVGEQQWEMLERIGAYAAGELGDEETREVEQLLFERPEYRGVAESYTRMLVMLTTFGSEPVEVPEAVVGYAIRRAHVSAFVRSAEAFAGALGRSYIDAFVYYLGLRRESYGGGT
jgi:anti-sigma factor RsiW